MAGLTTYGQQKILDYLLSATAFPNVAGPLFVALYTVTPTDAAASGTEVTGGAYARVSVTQNATNWPAASAATPSVKASGTAFTFPTPTANWGVVVAWAILDASTAGNMVTYGAVSPSKTVNNGDPAPSFAVGALTVTCD